MSELTPGDEQLLSDIDEYGWHVVKVMGDETGPNFCYSIGMLETFDLPEIVIIGLPLDLGHELINYIGDDLRAGKKYEASKYYSDLIENHDCYMVEVEKSNYEEYFGFGSLYYQNNEFPVLQCVYPSEDGAYPWEWLEEDQWHQPVLGSLGGDQVN